MRVLLTGASSFTGYWFARLLAEAGHEVVAPLRKPLAAYADGVRGERVRRLANVAEIVEDCVFGSLRFAELARRGFDLLCHHAAQVGDYRSPDFDIAGALRANTLNLREVLANGTFKAVALTGSVFENDEGAGNAPLVAFSPYGVSKALTAEVVAFRCREAGIGYGKFVIPNPFGPLEEPRFCAYLMRTWKAGEVAKVNTPAYIRDNIHVRLLALAYVRYAEELAAGSASARFNPSGYVETQGRFAERFASEMRDRLGLACGLDLARQSEFPEPVMRVNTDPAALFVSNWNEQEAWDELADGYRA
ncbi:NAD(P)-dependent oxidoreductase [Rhodopseudomonas sp. G2_2311]|uniref:NAD-dependent epimerase/dehydratase family protein n=1 Tax=Rhodopseudomonas sp. G2_2311 TaxID=3114287 RepID=UPI0039C5AECA